MSLQNLLASIRQLKCEVAETKTIIDFYLANTNEPLDERWQLYQELPSFLRNHESDIQDFLYKTDGSALELCILTDWSRYEVVKVNDFLEEWATSLAQHQVDIVATKEYILKRNLGSFRYDW